MIPFISVISTGNAVADPGEGPGGPDPRLFSVQAGARRAETEKTFFGDQPPPPPYLMVLKTAPRPLSQGLDLAIQCCAGIPAGRGGAVLPYIILLYGYLPPNGVVILKLLIWDVVSISEVFSRTGYNISNARKLQFCKQLFEITQGQIAFEKYSSMR